MEKKCQVVMLPTDKASNIFLVHHYNILHLLGKKRDKDLTGYPQHLYILSDEEIKESDWILWKKNDKEILLRQVFKYKNSNKLFIIAEHNVDIKISKSFMFKIIATTNPELIQCTKSPIDRHLDCNGTGSISEDFIEAYIKSYNESNVIKEVMVEYENDRPNDFDDGNGFTDFKYNQVLKLRPDNTIIIHPATKKSYSRDEVFELLKELRRECIEAHNKGISPENVCIAQYV